MRTSLLSLVLALAITTPALANHKPGHPAPAPAPGKLTLAAAPNPVKFGSPVTFSGKLTGNASSGKTVQLLQDPFPFDTFTEAGSAVTDANGDYTLTHTPTMNTRYHTRQGATDSEIVTVLVASRIRLRVSDRTPRAGTRVRFYGRVCPEHDGASVAIRRRTAAGTWRAVTRAVLADAGVCSTFSKRLRIRRDGAYRVTLSADADHAAGRSGIRRLNVH